MTRASKLSTFIGIQVVKEDQKENEQEVNMLKSNYFDQNTDLCHNRIQSNFATKWHKVKFLTYLYNMSKREFIYNFIFIYA